MDIDLVKFISELISEAEKLNNAADPRYGDSGYLIKMIASQVCMSLAQALLNSSKTGEIR